MFIVLVDLHLKFETPHRNGLASFTYISHGIPVKKFEKHINYFVTKCQMHLTTSTLFIKCDVRHVFVVFCFVLCPCPCLFTFIIFEFYMKRCVDFVVIIDPVNCYYLISRLVAITDRCKTVDKIATKRFRSRCQYCQATRVSNEKHRLINQCTWIM